MRLPTRLRVSCQMWECGSIFPCPPSISMCVPPLPIACKQGMRTQGHKGGVQMAFACHTPLLLRVHRLVRTLFPLVRALPPTPPPPPSLPPSSLLLHPSILLPHLLPCASPPCSRALSACSGGHTFPRTPGGPPSPIAAWPPPYAHPPSLACPRTLHSPFATCTERGWRGNQWGGVARAGGSTPPPLCVPAPKWAGPPLPPFPPLLPGLCAGGTRKQAPPSPLCAPPPFARRGNTRMGGHVEGKARPLLVRQ